MEISNTLFYFYQCFKINLFYYWLIKFFTYDIKVNKIKIEDINEETIIDIKGETWIDIEGEISGYGQWVEFE